MNWHFRSSPAFITFVISYAVFTDQFLYSSIIPVIPFALHDRLGLPDEEKQYWTAVMFAVFGIACTVASVPWALLSYRFSSHKTPFQIGLAVLVGATLLLWLGRDLATQLTGRTLQGLGSSIVWVTGMAALADAVGSAHIGEATGWVAIALNAGSLIAPLVGGSIFERSGYHAVYALIMAVLVLDVVFRFIMKERLGAAINNPLDVTTVTPRIGSIHSKPAEIKEQFSEEGKCDKFPESQVQEYDLEAGSDQSAAAAGVDNKAVEWTKGRTVPVILQMLFVPRMIAASWGILALAGVLSGFQTILPLVVHKIFGWNAEGGGLVFLPLTVPALLGPFVGRLTDRFGGRWFSFLSFLFMAPSLILLRLVEDNSIGHKIMLCTLLTCIGSCSTLALEPLFAEITKVADEVHASSLGRSQPRQNSYLEAYALFSTAWGAGDVVGPFLAGFILNAAGWRTTTWVLGLLAGVSAIPAVLFCDGYIWSLPPRRSSSSV